MRVDEDEGAVLGVLFEKVVVSAAAASRRKKLWNLERPE